MNVDQQELNKFAILAQQWWDIDGDLKTLHDINPARLQFIKSFCDLSEKSVLDVGCGGGILTEAMAREAHQVDGIDREESVIAVAKQHAVASKLTIAYRVEAIEQQTQVYDVVTCMEMLEHVPDPALIIESCARAVKPGGWCFLSTINRSVKAYVTAILAAEYLLRILPRQTHDYKKFIKPSELAKSLRQHGLNLVAIKGLNYNPLSRGASLSHDVDVNYLVATQKLD